MKVQHFLPLCPFLMKALVETSIHASIIHGSQWVENQYVDLESLMSCVIEEEDELMFVQVQHAAEFCHVFGQVSPCPDSGLASGK